MIGLAGRERCRRLIERKDPAVERERARDLQQLAVRDRQAIDRRVGRHGEVQAGEQIRRAGPHVGLAETTEASRFLCFRRVHVAQ